MDKKKLVIVLVLILIVCVLIAVGVQNINKNGGNEINISSGDKNIVNEDDKNNSTIKLEVNSISKSLASSYESIVRSVNLLKLGRYEYKLAYVNEDDIPDLVIDYPGYYCGIITQIDGELYAVKNEEDGENKKIENIINEVGFEKLLGYGTSGRTGYEYYPKKGFITCHIPGFEEAYIEYSVVEGNTLKSEGMKTIYVSSGDESEVNQKVNEKIEECKNINAISLNDNTMSYNDFISSIKTITK